MQLLLREFQPEHLRRLARGDLIRRAGTHRVLSSPVLFRFPFVQLHRHRLHDLGADVASNQADTDIRNPCLPAHRVLLAIGIDQAAQQESLETSRSKVSAPSFSPSAIVRYGAKLSTRSATVKPCLTARVAA